MRIVKHKPQARFAGGEQRCLEVGDLQKLSRQITKEVGTAQCDPAPFVPTSSRPHRAYIHVFLVSEGCGECELWFGH